MNTTAQELKDRAAIYRLLAQLYRKELTLELSTKLGATGLLDLLEDNGYRIGKEKLTRDDHIQELRREYTRVFVGPGRHVSPYGSVHHPDDPRKGQLWGDTTVWVRRFVSDHGLRFDGRSYGGIPDHVGHILELFSILLDREAVAREAGESDRAERLASSQRHLFEKQMDRWMPSFCNQVGKMARLDFYREIARLTIDLLEAEQERLVPSKHGP